MKLTLTFFGLLSLHLVDSLCMDLLKQYYDCQNIKMTFVDLNDRYTHIDSSYYEPDKSVRNNTLPDSFYKNLSIMTYDQGMALIQKIYLETDSKCTTEFCKCVRMSFIDQETIGMHSLLFRNATNFPQAKSIIEQLDKKFESQKLLLEEINSLNTFNLPSLGQFCYNMEFTQTRLSFYELENCQKFNKSLYDACMWTVSVVNRTLETSVNNSMLEKSLVCLLLNLKSCPSETQRFLAMSYWVLYFPNLKWNGFSLSAYFDQLIKRANQFNPNFLFAEHMVEVFYHFYGIDTYRGQKNSVPVNSTNITLNLFRSPLNAISCQTQLFDFVRFFKYTLLFFVNGSLPKQLVYNITVKKQRLVGLAVKDQKGLGIFQVYQSEDGRLNIYDFNSNSRVLLFPERIILLSPISLWENASGILINGFNKSTNASPTQGQLKNFITLHVEFDFNSFYK